MEEFRDNEIVFITLINKGYLDFTRNFLTSMIRSNCSFKLIVFCIDNECIERLKVFPNCVCIDANIFLKERFSDRLCIWETLDYKKIVFAKLDAMIYTLERAIELNIKYIGYLDTDMIIFRDPRSIFINELNNNPTIDFICGCDEPHRIGKCSNIHKCGNICSGTIAIRVKPEIIELLKYTNDDVLRHAGDQQFLKYNFDLKGIKYQTFNRQFIVNGSIFHLKKPLPKDIHILHYNFMVGLTKKNKMIRNRHWLI